MKNLSPFWIAVYTFTISIVLVIAAFASSQIRSHIIPTGDVSLSIPYSKYLVGETINFSIKNNFNSPIYVLNNCPNEPLAVYRQTNSQWIRQHLQAPIGSCINENRQISIEPGKSVEGSFKYWQKMFETPGKYRIVAFVEHNNDLPYQDIEIIETKQSAETVNTIVAPTINPPVQPNTSSIKESSEDSDEPEEIESDD